MSEPVTISFTLHDAAPDIQLASILSDAVKHFRDGTFPTLPPELIAPVVDWLHAKYGSKSK